ncbi:hypothetical protein [Marinifilum fragile]|uniref:hypothetical protein n=1 Tax=Marinifilum fragile TaxID=570161 RepID=UPI002AA67023|nr:hypothetical protein [Marinifilum fragile]
MLLNVQSSITDWIQASGVLLGVPVTAYSLIRLFIKSKEKDKKLTALEDIAVSQNVVIGKMNQQVIALQNQTEVLSAHNDLVKDGNYFLKKQLDLQLEAILEDKNYKNEYLNILEKERKLHLKPHFTYDGGGGNGKSFTFRFKNIGERAILKSFKKPNSDLAYFNPKFKDGDIVDKNGKIEIIISSSQRESRIDNIKLDLILNFTNSDDDSYFQKVSIDSSKVNIQKPVESE